MFHTLRCVLDHYANDDVVPNLHISMAFLWSLVQVPQTMRYVETEVPWQALTRFLNHIYKDVDMAKIPDLQGDRFPASMSQQAHDASNVPEDLLMRGQIWSCFYYPTGYFNVAHLEDDDERSFELRTAAPRRAERCLWLGHRIASVSNRPLVPLGIQIAESVQMNRWIRFDKASRQFVVTEIGLKLEDLRNRDTVFDHNCSEGGNPATDPGPNFNT